MQPALLAKVTPLDTDTCVPTEGPPAADREHTHLPIHVHTSTYSVSYFKESFTSLYLALFDR